MLGGPLSGFCGPLDVGLPPHDAEERGYEHSGPDRQSHLCATGITAYLKNRAGPQVFAFAPAWALFAPDLSAMPQDAQHAHVMAIHPLFTGSCLAILSLPLPSPYQPKRRFCLRP